MNHRRIGPRGFSLIEVMVVIVIIGLLAGAVALQVTGYMDSAEINLARSDITTIMDAVELYRLENKRYPTNEEGLSVLPIDNRNDPWGNPYEYNSPGPSGEPYEIVTYGSDGREGGESTAADIYSWQVREGSGG
ncbi:type II secretion system protein GspG [Mucisphaera sp.]|uniref:type II secretion system protein GspG n=1 Tax=Mucisphaera sp. TaxID=2913024 RepID=UPI003D14D63C